MGVPKIVIASYTNCSAPDGFVKRVELFVISYFILLGDWFPSLVMLNYFFYLEFFFIISLCWGLGIIS